VIVPASLRLVWAEEIERWLPHVRPGQVVVIEGKEDRLCDLPDVGRRAQLPQITITSYEMMKRLSCPACQKLPGHSGSGGRGGSKAGRGGGRGGRGGKGAAAAAGGAEGVEAAAAAAAAAASAASAGRSKRCGVCTGPGKRLLLLPNVPGVVSKEVALQSSCYLLLCSMHDYLVMSGRAAAASCVFACCSLSPCSACNASVHFCCPAANM
jgi:hypothetical protein